MSLEVVSVFNSRSRLPFLHLWALKIFGSIRLGLVATSTRATSFLGSTSLGSYTSVEFVSNPSYFELSGNGTIAWENLTFFPASASSSSSLTRHPLHPHLVASSLLLGKSRIDTVFFSCFFKGGTWNATVPEVEEAAQKTISSMLLAADWHLGIVSSFTALGQHSPPWLIMAQTLHWPRSLSYRNWNSMTWE